MKKPPSAKRLILSLSACLPSILLTAIGLRALIHGKLLNITWLLAYVCLPAASALLVLRMIRSGMKTWIKALAYPLILLLGAFLVILISILGRFEWLHRYEGELLQTSYARLAEEAELMPIPDELNSASDMEYFAYSSGQFIFSWQSHALFCRYDPSVYAEEKALLNQKYRFEEEPVGSLSPSAELDGYLLRLLDLTEYDSELRYPGILMLIGTNDQRCEIVYLFYNDPELDSIDSLTGLLTKFGGWNHMR